MAKPKPRPIKYRELQAELESIVAAMQTGEPDVDKAIAQYERGMEIVGQLQAYLETAENKVKAIKRKFDDTE